MSDALDEARIDMTTNWTPTLQALVSRAGTPYLPSDSDQETKSFSIV